MANIEGLTEAQCEQLKGLKVGNILLIEPTTKVTITPAKGDDTESDSDDASDAEDGEMQRDSEESSGHNTAGEATSGADAEANDALELSRVDFDSEAGEIIVDREMREHVENTTPNTNKDIRKAAVYLVRAFSKDKAQNTTDITVCEMAYSRYASHAHTTSYRVLGDELVYNWKLGISPTPMTPFKNTSIKDLITNDTYSYILIPNCSARNIVTILHDGFCPAKCDDGFLSYQLEMEDMLNEGKRTLPDYTPICPACMGRDLAVEQYALRDTLDSSSSGTMDLGMAVEFMGRLNTARLALGYEFQQFDEREWGYMFDDMLSEDGGDGQGINADGNWGYYEEATDPAAGTVARPASDDAVAALPRKTFAELKESTAEGKADCLIC